MDNLKNAHATLDVAIDNLRFALHQQLDAAHYFEQSKYSDELTEHFENTGRATAICWRQVMSIVISIAGNDWLDNRRRLQQLEGLRFMSWLKNSVIEPLKPYDGLPQHTTTEAEAERLNQELGTTGFTVVVDDAGEERIVYKVGDNP